MEAYLSPHERNVEALADARKLANRILVQTGDVDSMESAGEYRYVFPRLRAIRRNAEALADILKEPK